MAVGGFLVAASFGIATLVELEVAVSEAKSIVSMLSIAFVIPYLDKGNDHAQAHRQWGCSPPQCLTVQVVKPGHH